MKKGDIICWQMLLWPKPIYGLHETYMPKIVFKEKRYLYTISGGLYQPIAYWRIKKIKPLV